MGDNTIYKVKNFYGDMDKIAAQMENYCNTLQYQYPETFTVISVNWLGSIEGAAATMLYLY